MSRKSKTPEPVRHQTSGKKSTKKRTREHLLTKSQLGANVLFACYVATAILSGFGYLHGLMLIVGDATTDEGVNEGNGIIFGLFVFIVTSIWIAFLIFIARVLWKAINDRYTTKIRNMALFSTVTTLLGLGLIYLRYGNSVLNETIPGALALVLILFAGSSLWAFAANRSLNEDY